MLKLEEEGPDAELKSGYLNAYSDDFKAEPGNVDLTTTVTDKLLRVDDLEAVNQALESGQLGEVCGFPVSSFKK